MTVFDRLERRFGWLSFPGFLRYYALLHILVFVLQFIRPDIGLMLRFDRDRIFAGEIWRIFTMFFADSQFGRPSLLAIVFLIFVVNFIFMVSDGLEGAWGTFKTSLFYYFGMVAVLMANFIYPFSVPGSGLVLYASAFLAFATLFPKVEILLFLLIPMQVRFLGIFMALGFLLQIVRDVALLPFYLAAFTNYLVWAAIPALRGTGQVLESVQRRRAFQAAKIPASEAFHTCTVCARTDVTNPELEFRTGRDGLEYCEEHLPD